MKVFNGKEFLKNTQVQIELSNGFSAIIGEIDPAAMEKFSAIGEASQFTDVKVAAASVLGTTPDKLNGVGIVELRGAMDFLFGSLLPSK